MIMTAEQAAEAARGLTFEKVWAALMESRERQAEAGRQQEKAFAEIRESRAEMRESRAETDKWLKATLADMNRVVANVTHQMGDMHNSVGRITEAMFAAKLWKKFDGIYNFTHGGPDKYWNDKKNRLAQVDMFLENGDYAMVVEVKTTLRTDSVDKHLERIGMVRQYMNERGDKRKLVGAVAGAVVPDEVCRYAQKHGLYVLTQSEDTVTLAASPRGFKAAEW